jgi:ATP-dependent DNA ligase
MLAAQAPASYVAWDLLALGDEDLRALPQATRCERLRAVFAGVTPPVHITPMTRDRAVAADWFARFEGAGLDGVMAKPEGLVYTPGKRLMLKIKHQRSADCVVAGFRWYKGGKGRLLGSILLGLYDGNGVLHHVGVCAGFKMADREALAQLLVPLVEGARDDHPWRDWADFQDAAEVAEQAGQRMPGAKSRWTKRDKDLSWVPLRLERVAEVSYDHLQGDRFRHSTHFKRWRDDKPVASCRYDQLEVTPPEELAALFR